MRTAVTLILIALAAAACGGSESSVDTSGGCADVVGVEITREDAGSFRLATTVRSDDEGWEAYADAWDVLAPDGTVLGTRVLTHPHVDEQPFTRSLGAVEIPGDVNVVTVRARHSVGGHCGADMQVEVPR